MDPSEVGKWVLTLAALITAVISLYSVRSNRNKVDSEAGVNKATEKEIETRAAGMSEETYQKREAFWQKKLDDSEKKLESEIGELREEVAWLRRLIEGHVPWDWEVVRTLKINGIEQRDPPTLNWVRQNPPEQKDAS
jgi:hypothetical protein